MSWLGVVFFLVVVVAVAWLLGTLVDRFRARAARESKPAAPRPRTTANYPRLVLTATFLAFALTGIYAPWNYIYSPADGPATTKPAPRAFVFEPPRPERDSPRLGVVLDGRRLMVEWLIVAALGAAGYVLARRTPVEWTGSMGTGPRSERRDP